MQNRYTGDIGDFGKLGLLRQLSAVGLPIGVNWYLTPDETHNGDGRHVGYLQRPAFAACDQALWSTLRELVSSGVRRVAALETAGLLQASYASDVLDLTNTSKQERNELRWIWHSREMEQLRGCALVFLDPDNGLIVPSRIGSIQSSKYVLPQELADYYRGGASVIYYQHKARRTDEFYAAQHHALVTSGAFPQASGLGLKFCTTSQRFYFFILQPYHADAVRECVRGMIETAWRKHFQEVAL